VAIATHCNLSPSDVAPDVHLDFINYDAYIMHQPTTQHFRNLLSTGDPDLLSVADVSAIGGHLPVFVAIFSLRMRISCYFPPFS